MSAFEKAPGVQLVAVRNLFFGESAKLSRSNDSKTRAKFLAADVELLHRIRKEQFALGRLGVRGRFTPEIWNAVLAA